MDDEYLTVFTISPAAGMSAFSRYQKLNIEFPTAASAEFSTNEKFVRRQVELSSQGDDIRRIVGTCADEVVNLQTMRFTH